jgi:hypothetical protein
LTDSHRTELWRRLALYLLLFGMLGTGLELVLLEHTEDRWQWTPLILLSLGFVAAAAATLQPTRSVVLGLRTVMALFVPAGALGIYLHLRSNFEFELEIHPTTGGFELLKEALYGAMPALAPGTMAQLGLLGLLVCFRHPSLTKSTPRGSDG